MRLAGRPVSPGRAEGLALVSVKPMSFLGGVDRESGAVVDPASDIRGESVAGRVLAFPHGKGSTVGSYVVYGLAKRGRGPAAIVNERTEAIVATGAILGGIPLVDRIDVSILASGDRLVVDGDAGTVDLPEVTERPVVTAFLRNKGRVLIVLRGERVGTFRGKWSGISGYIEGEEPALRRARQEVREETGIREARLVARGPVIRTRWESTVFAIHPFLFDVATRRVRLDWENVEARWVRPQDMEGIATVPRLRDVLASVFPDARPAGRGPGRPPARGGGAGARRGRRGSRRTGGSRRASRPGPAGPGRASGP
ncbi:MAG: DUF126 domain-containing protein [Methanobacteriota archaeon]|nr:MAG: DUF126 domain-containing protein [Euryarchaeota archaeon]